MTEELELVDNIDHQSSRGGNSFLSYAKFYSVSVMF